LFESDPEVISNAADRQMVHVRTYQGGQHSQWSQKILNELSTARVCLLSPEKKTQYDVGLRREISARRPPAVLLPRPLAPLADPVPPSSSQTPQTTGPSDGVELPFSPEAPIPDFSENSEFSAGTADGLDAVELPFSTESATIAQTEEFDPLAPSPIAAEGDATEDLGAFSPPLVSGRTVTRRRRRNRTPGVWISVIAVIAVILLLLIAWALNSPAPDVGGPSKRPAPSTHGDSRPTTPARK
jgi:hypothetical protein